MASFRARVSCFFGGGIILLALFAIGIEANYTSMYVDVIEASSETNVSSEVIVVTDVVVEQLPEVEQMPEVAQEDVPNLALESFAEVVNSEEPVDFFVGDLTEISHAGEENTEVVTTEETASQVEVFDAPSSTDISSENIISSSSEPVSPEVSREISSVVAVESEQVVSSESVILVNRNFSLVDLNREQQNKILKKLRNESMAAIITKYYFKEAFGEEDFTYLEDSVYYLKFNLDSLWLDSQEDLEADFSLVDSDDGYLAEHKLYFVDLFFSKNIDYETLHKNTILLQSADGKEIPVNKIFAFGKEVVLVSESEFEPESLIVEFKGFSGLSGVYSLQSRINDYKTLVAEAETEYSAVVADDITFDASKLSFGELDKYANPSSTIAIKIPVTNRLQDKCAILLFGDQMRKEGGEGSIPLSGVSLVTDFSFGLPIDQSLVDGFVASKNAAFLGFAYIGDLELIENYYALYLNLQIPVETTRGKYSADLSFELACQ